MVYKIFTHLDTMHWQFFLSQNNRAFGSLCLTSTKICLQKWVAILRMSFIHRGMLDEVKASERSLTSSGVGRADMVSIIAVSLCVPFLQWAENLRNWWCETLVSVQDYHQTAVCCIALRITCGICVCVCVCVCVCMYVCMYVCIYVSIFLKIIY